MDTDRIVPMRVSDLAFDLRNPRLPEYDLAGDAAETDVIRVLWDTMDVKELACPSPRAGSSSTSR